MINYLDNEIKIIEQKKLEKVIKGLEECLSASCRGFKPGIYCPMPDDVWNNVRDALALLKAQGPVNSNREQYQCNKCKFYEGVHNVMGHAPCSLWGIGGVIWNDYCSRFNLWKESEVK